MTPISGNLMTLGRQVVIYTETGMDISFSDLIM